MAPSQAEMDKIRLPYVKLDQGKPGKLIQLSDLKWFSVPLSIPFNGQRINCGKIEVCSPVRKDDLFIPVTKSELWDMAKRLNVGQTDSGKIFPLTRTVADLAQNAALYEDPIKEYGAMQGDPQLPDFVKFSGMLMKNNYQHSQSRLVTGCHKNWLLSRGNPGSQPKAAGTFNYGFYVPRQFMEDPGGPYLDQQYGVINKLMGGHGDQHWDYSQLIQFMRKLQCTLTNAQFQLTNAELPDLPRQPRDPIPFLAPSPGVTEPIKGLLNAAANPVVFPTLKEMLLKGNPAVWDEVNPTKPPDQWRLQATDLP